jgi:hypothetical protein
MLIMVLHGVHQRNARHEETPIITHSCAGIEKGAPGSNGTALGASNKGHCTGRGRQNIYGTNPRIMCKDGQQRDCSVVIGCTQGEDRAGPNTSNKAHGEVPSDRKRDQRSTQGLGVSGRATCQCWGPVGSRMNQRERIFWEERHAKGEQQLEGKVARAHAWKT